MLPSLHNDQLSRGKLSQLNLTLDQQSNQAQYLNSPKAYLFLFRYRNNNAVYSNNENTISVYFDDRNTITTYFTN